MKKCYDCGQKFQPANKYQAVCNTCLDNTETPKIQVYGYKTAWGEYERKWGERSATPMPTMQEKHL